VTGLSSLRWRFIGGALIWGAGLLLLAHLGSVALVIGRPAFFGVLHMILLFSSAIVLMVCGLWLSVGGLKTLTHLRHRLAAVHDGHERQVEGRYPDEVQPLVNDLNVLLAHQDSRVREALTKAGNLAHGLKTPLAVLAQEADRAESEGHTELAATLRQQVDRMRRQVEYHLAHARAAASGATPGARCAVAASAEGLARTLERLHAGRALTIAVDVPPDHAVRGQREDLDEMLGNLLDNACKYARRHVRLTSANGDDRIQISVEDDGPGVPQQMREVVLQRGVRADQAAPGSGFGLAIVRELAELYGGSIALDTSTLGGLRARLTLPAAGSFRPRSAGPRVN
jgi:signal transduction histidine kinase